MLRTKAISGELLELQKEIQGYADEFGLDYFDQVFEMCDYDTINILAAQGGFPIRYPHWKFGMDYDQLSKGYRYGIQKIYEMVINTDPCYAYLLEVNNWLDQKFVMAHVYGHNDFFKNNMWFANTDRNMMDVMANHGSKIRRYMERYGQNKVEKFIDRVLSLENLLDINTLFETTDVIKSRKEKMRKFNQEKQTDGYMVDDRSQALKSFMRTKKKQDHSPTDSASTVDGDVNNDSSNGEMELKAEKNTYKGQRDILKFLIDNAPLENWEVDVLACLREEAYYFLPQRITKIMNEGWASYWHSTIMNTRALDASEFVDFAVKHAGVMAMSKQNINPYKIGIELFRDIEFRWNTGRFGKEYNECTDMNKKENWDTKAMLGREKIFEIRRTHNDISFINEFLTPEFCNRQQLFTYKFNPRSQRMEIDKREFEEIKQKLLTQLTNFGSPIIEVEDSNFKNRKELLLRHVHYGVDLDMSFAEETMRNLYSMWKRPINLATVSEEKPVILNFEGDSLKILNE